MAAAAAVLLGTTGTAAAIGPEPLDATAAASWRAVIGAIGLVVLAAILRQPPWRYPLPWRWLAIGGGGFAVNQLAFFEAIAGSGVAVATLVTVGTAPLAAGVVDWAVHRSRPEPRWSFGVILALAGVAALTVGTASTRFEVGGSATPSSPARRLRCSESLPNSSSAVGRSSRRWRR